MALMRTITIMLLIAHRAVAAGSSECPSSYTSQNGLSFTTYCKYDLPNGDDVDCSQDYSCDLKHISNTATMEACMDACSMYDYARCYSVSYSSKSGDCYLKGSSFNSSSLIVQDDEWNSAIAKASQLKTPDNISCPSQNFNASTGMPFEVVCNKILTSAGGDYCSSSGPPCVYHANSLQECAEHCAAAHPLCKGVSWNADMNDGYPNCYLKKLVAESNSFADGIVVHSARITADALGHMNISIPDGYNYTSPNGAYFNISQGDKRSGASNFSSVHADSIGQCMDSCAFSNQTCIGALFDNVIANGYSNCYLLNNTGSPYTGANVTFAQLSKAPSSAATPSSSAQSSATSTSGSKAWVAAPVIISLALVAMIAAFLTWRRRRQHHREAARASSYGMLRTDPDEEAIEEDGTHPFAPVEVNRESYVPEMLRVQDPHELPADHVRNRVHQ